MPRNWNAALGTLAPGTDESKSLQAALLESGAGLAEVLMTPTGLNPYRIVVSMRNT